MATKRGRLFTCVQVSITLTAASFGVAGQIIFDLGADFTAKADRALLNVTASHFWLTGWWRQGSTGATSPIATAFTLAIVRANVGMDAGDFNGLANHSGDIVLFDCRPLQEATVALAPLVPANGGPGGSNFALESKGQRKIARREDTLFLVVEKAVVTEQAPVLHAAITTLWLLP